MYRGRDVTMTPLAVSGEDINEVIVTLTNYVASLGGSVRAPSGAAPDTALVVLFPVDAAHRAAQGLFPAQMKTAPVTLAGIYHFPALPAGDYFVAAIDRSQAATWRDPESLVRLERTATRISLSWGQSRSTDLTLAGGR